MSFLQLSPCRSSNLIRVVPSTLSVSFLQAYPCRSSNLICAVPPGISRVVPPTLSRVVPYFASYAVPATTFRVVLALPNVLSLQPHPVVPAVASRAVPAVAPMSFRHPPGVSFHGFNI